MLSSPAIKARRETSHPTLLPMLWTLPCSLRRSFGTLATLLVVVGLLCIGTAPGRAQDPTLILWVYDKNVSDSQFGDYAGVSATAIGPVHKGLDVEGLACIGATAYAVSGWDGKQPSQLYTLHLDRARNQSTLTPIGLIQTASGAPFYEVSSLDEDANGQLWGYASEPGLNSAGQGIVQIDPATAQATLVVSATLDVAGIDWHDNVLWLVMNNTIYTWTPGAAITPAFQIPGMKHIEALESIGDYLYVAEHGQARMLLLNPHTGEQVAGAGFTVPEDVEGLTDCESPPAATPTATATASATPTLTPSPSATLMATPTASSTPTATPSPPPTLLPTATASATPTETPAPTLTSTPTPTPQPPAVLTPTATVAFTGLEPGVEPALPSTLFLPVVAR
jgi:hypothetical protein